MARKSDPVYYDANGNVVEPHKKKKKGGCLKFILIGIIVIIAIAVISSMLGGGSDGDGASVEGAKSVGMGLLPISSVYSDGAESVPLVLLTTVEVPACLAAMV